MNFNINASVGAMFKLVRHKGDPSKAIEETDFFNNIVLNSGLARMSSNSWGGYCHIGTGNSTPVVTQTGLDNVIATTTNFIIDASRQAGHQVSTLPYYVWQRQTWRFNPGVGTGNISELGMGWSTTELWNRALVKDINGTPVTITKLADEYLDVIMELRVYLPNTTTGSFNLLNKLGTVLSTHNYTIKPIIVPGALSTVLTTTKVELPSLTAYTGTMASGNNITLPSGTSMPNSSTGNVVTNPTTTSIQSVFMFKLPEGNTGAHKSFTCFIRGILSNNSYVGLQWELDNPISKNSSQELTYSVTVSWAGYTP